MPGKDAQVFPLPSSSHTRGEERKQKDEILTASKERSLKMTLAATDEILTSHKTHLKMAEKEDEIATSPNKKNG
ncbi:MAG: hypothetical protein GX428_06790 [Candidatus Atribacteria bacterium]|nr:hypothetical protein [Candidatus Atribacteria bacterium]